MYFLLSKISQENGGWVGNKTFASDFDRKYICYPAISDTLFSQILLYLHLKPSELKHLKINVFFKKIFQGKLFFFFRWW